MMDFFFLLQVRDEYIKWLTCTCGKDIIVVSLWEFRQPSHRLERYVIWNIWVIMKNLFWQRDAPSVSEDLDRKTADGKKDDDQSWGRGKELYAYLFIFIFISFKTWMHAIHNLKTNLEWIASGCCKEIALLLFLQWFNATILHRTRL